MEVALDNNIAIDILNGKTNITTLLTTYSNVYLPVTVCGELLFGAKNSTRFVTNVPLYQAFIRTYRILGINQIVSEKYSDIRLQLKKAGHPIPENDVWIAATCLAYDLPLLTHDNHFQFVTALQVLSI